MAPSCFQEVQRLIGPQLRSLECSTVGCSPPKEFRLLLNVREWDVARAKAGGRRWGRCACACVHVSPSRRLRHLCPFLTRCCSPFIILGWRASLVTGMRPGRGCAWHGNMSPGAPVPAGQTAGHSHIQIFGLSLLSQPSPMFEPTSSPRWDSILCH